MNIITQEVSGVWQRFSGDTNLDARKVTQLVADGVWNGDDLQKYGLRAAEPFVVPEGKRAVGPERFSEDGTAQVFDVQDEPQRVPFSIYPLQARKALRLTGLKDQVDAYIATLDDASKEEWDYALEVRRDNPIILAGAAALGMTDAQVDDLFRLGETL